MASNSLDQGRVDAATLGIRPPGYRLPAELRLGRVRLQVSSIDRSLGFYRDLLGFRVLDRSAGVVSLGAAGSTEPLIILREKREARPVPRRGRLGLYHFAVLLPDRASLGRLLSHLASAGAYAGMSDHLVSEAIYLTDPDGLGIEIYADRPRSSWTQRGSELEMTTAPLDVNDVVAAARGEPWTGMPAGTTIGHVHLYVGAIPEAKAFYHAALGFDVVVSSYPGALFMSAGGYHHHLGTNTWAAGAAPATDDDARLMDWEIALPNRNSVEQAVESLRAAGAEVAEVDEAWVVRDPWGTPLRIRAD